MSLDTAPFDPVTLGTAPFDPVTLGTAPLDPVTLGTAPLDPVTLGTAPLDPVTLGTAPFDAVILAGGTARRLGGADKPAVMIGETTLLDRVLAAVGGARRIVVVGPARPVSGSVIWCREEPPGTGPLAGLVAALPHTDAAHVLVLAADLPWIAPAVPALRHALASAPAVALADPTGRLNPLVAGWRRPVLVDALAAIGPVANMPMRALTGHVTITAVADPEGWGEDCDTWADVARARASAEEHR